MSDTLPPLPAPYDHFREWTMGDDPIDVPGYTADQMRAYALAARQQAQVPEGFVPAFVLRNVLATLEHENTSGSAIQDTIWHSPGETLFDYIENSLEEFAAAPQAAQPEREAILARLEAVPVPRKWNLYGTKHHWVRDGAFDDYRAAMLAELNRGE